jgi:hypothetical protein
MQIVIGRGNRRQSFDLGSPGARTKEVSERLAWNVKQILFDRGIIPNLG